MSKKLQTGKYATRDELIQNVHFCYHHEGQNKEQVSRTTGISEGLVTEILRQKKKR